MDLDPASESGRAGQGLPDGPEGPEMSVNSLTNGLPSEGEYSAVPEHNATAPRVRTLRARPSVGSSAPVASGVRKLSDADLEAIRYRLGPEGIAEKRSQILQEKELAVKGIVDEHDTALREQFHLERFVTMITGWDPAYKHFEHNLFDLVPQPANAEAGPSRSRGARTSLPSRQTRRQAHDQTDIFTSTSAPAPVPIAASSKGKGKAVAGDNGDADLMPPPALPLAKGKKGRRQTLGPAALSEASLDESEPESALGKGKKRGRASLPAPAPELQTKRPPGRTRKSEASDSTGVEGTGRTEGKGAAAKRKRNERPEVSLATPATGTPDPSSSVPPDPIRSPTPEPIELPSLADVRFEPPPIRRWPRRNGSRKVTFTDPPQMEIPEPSFSGDIAAYLSSYTHLDDNVPTPELAVLESRAEREGFIHNRVNHLMNQGRLSRIFDEDPSVPASAKAVKQPHAVVRQQDHQEALMTHMTQVRNAMLSEAKAKPVVCRKVARMILAHWDHIEGREERERLKEEKELKRRGKELVKALRKRWALAVKVVRAKITAEQKAEQDRLGKEHLQSMLKRSTGLLEAQQEFDLDSQADGDGAEDNGEASDDGDLPGGDENSDTGESDGTEEVSAAEVSEEEEEEEEDDGEEADDDEPEDEDAGHAALAELIGQNTSSTLKSPAAAGLGEESCGIEDIDGTSVEPLLANQETADNDKGADSIATAAKAAIASKEDVTMDEDDMAVDMSDALALQPPSSPSGPEGSTAVAADDAPSIGQEANLNGVRDAAAAAALAKTLTSPPEQPAQEVDSREPPAETPAVESESTKPLSANGHGLNGQSPPIVPPPSTFPAIRSRRARAVAKPLPPPKVEDPDANDVEFAAPENGDVVDDEDHLMDVEMEEDDEDGSQADSEDAGLLADADIPIEELLRRYGYDVPAVHGADTEDQAFPVSNGVTPPPADDVADQSLTDNALGNGHSPTLVIDGKRQRRVRHVWTPEDNPPRPAKKPKIEVVKTEESEDDSDSASSLAETDPSEDEEEADEEDVEMEPEDPNAPKIRPPFLLRGTLRPYQHAGLDWLAGLYANNMNGILADEMGLGKTIQTISLLAHLACDRGVWGQHLIIVPTSVILNWEMEFKKFLPGFKVLTYYGNQKERKEKRVGWLTEHAWQVCITSYQIVLADQHIFRRKNWTYMILDEAHNIKNFRSQRWQTLLGFKAQRRLLLTGTPLQNNLMELWSLLYFLMPHGVAEEATAVVGFANHKDFMEWFSNPMDKAIESGDALDAETIATVNKLHTLLRPFILRRLKSEVETQLPGKFEHVVYCKLSKRQRFLYDEFMSRASTREALSSGGYLGVMNTLMQLRKVCNHPDLFEVRPVRTSFAMERSVASEFSPTELLVRRLLDPDHDVFQIDLLSNESLGALTARSIRRLDASDLLPHAILPVRKGRQPATPKRDVRTVEGWLKYRAWSENEASVQRWRHTRDVNRSRCRVTPIYGSTLLDMLTRPRKLNKEKSRPDEPIVDTTLVYRPSLPLVKSLEQRISHSQDLVERFAIIPPNVVARDVSQHALPALDIVKHPEVLDDRFDTLHHAATKLQIAFPDASLLQYDCGKLQKLYEMLRDLKANSHRVLIFTQMTRVLDILEIFLSFNGHRYLRLDGSTKIEDRQVITERFNSDARIFCFIASSRSGGVGINLTGADTVFFYDSDWNPSMDRQCMDRAHRIGQTREVHIYRFVSSHTVEENMLKKANQKRLLDRMVIQDGDFTTEFFGKVDWRDMIDDGQARVEEREGIEDVVVEDGPEAEDVTELAPRRGEEREFARIVAEVEDEEDVDAARIALGEGEMDMGDFDAATAVASKAGAAAPEKKARFESERATSASATPVPRQSASVPPEAGHGEEEYDEEDDVGAVDDYMLKWVEEDWAFFISYRA